ncbi:ABC transporter ATP-binding protein, partial [Enterococcus faecalis]|nr:ABC transporter ATP-binding protein [Enterococcus faecalis]
IVNNIQTGIPFHSPEFFSLIILFPILNVFSELFNNLNTYLSSRYSDILNFKFSELQLKSVFKHSLEDFENPEFYDLIQRAEQAGGVYPFQIIMTMVSVSSILLTSISYIIILLRWKWWTIILLFLFPFISSIKTLRLSKDEFTIMYSRTNLERKSWYYANLLNKDEFFKETTLYSLGNNFLEEFTNLRKKFINENKKMYRRRNKFTFLVSFITIFTTSIILCIVFYEASVGIILIGSLMTYVNSISTLKNNFSSIINSFFSLHQQSLYAKNILDLLDYKSIPEEKPNHQKKITIKQINSIELKNVSFKYVQSSRYALKDISLNFEKGKKYIIVGKNGSGKSTLLKIILGFYNNFEGEMLINEIPFSDIDINSYRKCISAVFQDFAKYQFKINETISLSKNRDIDMRDIKKAASEANASQFIKQLPFKYEQQLGSWFPNGIQLSGGEWQKVSIARAFYKDNASLVVLDEPSSALDPISEEKVFKSYKSLVNNKIGIFVTHRIKNIDFEGDIIVLNLGKISEYGKQSDLIKKQGLFYELSTAKKQF